MDERHIGGLWCHQVLELLDVFVEQDLSPTMLAAVRQHVADCDACARFGAAYALLVQEMQKPVEPELDAERLARLRQRVREDV